MHAAQEHDATQDTRPAPVRVFMYQVDADDRITRVSDAWIRFATENGAASLGRSDVVGRPLWEFITDLETGHLYRLIFERVRESRTSRTVPFRCDSPELRRFMELAIEPAADGHLDLTGRLLREEARPPVAVLAPHPPDSSEMLSICGWCKRVCTGPDEGDWCEVEEAVTRMRLFDRTLLPQLSHVTCPACASRAREALGR